MITRFQKASSYQLNQLNSETMKSKESCCICHRIAHIKIANNFEKDGQAFFVCNECNRFFLKGLGADERVKTLQKAFELSDKQKIHLPYAINAARGVYTLQEARRRTRLLRREQRGKTSDLYSLGRRMPGNFGSRQ